MKNILIAAVVAAGSLAFAVPASQAASTSVTVTNNGSVRVKERTYRPHHRAGCYTKTVKTYRNGKVIIRKTRVCR